MVSKYSVKKPFTVLVAVILVLVLGYVSITKMTPDLLPEMSFPYIMLMTTYPGASPEEVESAVTKPLEQTMASLDDIKEITSTSAENYSIVLLTFEDSVNTDVAMMDIQRGISTLSASWDDTIGTPVVTELSSDLIPTLVAAVSYEGKDPLELSAFVNDTLSIELEGINGVASVTKTGLVLQRIEIELDEDKIDALNKKLYAAIDKEFEEAMGELNDAQEKLREGETTLQEGKEALEKGEAALNAGRRQGNAALNDAQEKLDEQNKQVTELLAQLREQRAQAAAGLDQVIEGQKQLTQLKYALMELEKAQGLFDEAIAAIEKDENLTPEQKQEAIALIQNSDEYKNLQSALAKIDESLAAQGIGRGDIDSTLETLKQTQQELEAAIPQLDQTISDLESGKAEIDKGYEELEKQRTALANRLGAAQNTLNEKKKELADGEAALESGKTQLDEAEKQAQEQLDAAKEAADLHNILTKELISQLLTAQNFSMPAGYLYEGDQQYLVNVGNTLDSVQALESTALFYPGVEDLDTIRLSDVAKVSLLDNKDTTYARINGESGVLLSFSKQSSYATATVGDNIKDRFTQLESRYEGLHFVSLLDQGDYIHMAMGTVVENLLMGAVLAILVLLLFLRDIRPTLIVGISIPVSVLFALVLMYFSGVTMNVISMAGLAIGVGMLVDNSIVVIENIYRLRSEGVPVIEAAITGAKQVTGAIIASTLTTVCVFVPILFVQGLTRKIFMDMVLTITYSLMASLIVALTVVPATVRGLLRKPVKAAPKSTVALLHGFEKVLRWCLNRRVLCLALAVAILVLSAWASLRKGFTYFPDSNGSQISVTATLPEDMEFADKCALSDEILSAVNTVPGLGDVGAMLGGGMAGAMGLGVSGGDSDLTIYALLDTNSGRNGNDVTADLRKALEPFADRAECTVSGMATMDSSMLTGDGITVNVFAGDLSTLRKGASVVAQALSQVEGLVDINDGSESLSPALQVTVDREKAIEHNLTVAQVYMAVANALKDSAAGAELKTSSATLSVTVYAKDGVPASVQEFEDLVLTAEKRDGTKEDVPLKDIASITETASPSSIRRSNQNRYISVTAAVDDAHNVTLVNAQAEKILASISLPAGCTMQLDGQGTTIMSAMKDLTWMLLLGILIIYLIMVAQFQSLLSPFIVMGTVPLAFAGAFLGLLIGNFTVSIVAMIGLIMLMGVVVNNGIVLVDCMNQLREEGIPKKEAIVKATVMRIRPVLMTAVTTILGLLPLALGMGMGAEIIQPVAVVCIGGLTYATLTTLLIIPILYDIMRREKKPAASEAPSIPEPEKAD